MNGSFWDNVTGTPEDAFTKEFVDIIPNGTKAIAKVIMAKNENFSICDGVKIEWEITEGEFKKKHIFQKLYTFDSKPEKAIKARNMLKLILDMFNIPITNNQPPVDLLLIQMTGKLAGLKIGEYQFPKENGKLMHGNNILEISPIEGFISEIGTYREFKNTKQIESAFTRNPTGAYPELNDDVPF